MGIFQSIAQFYQDGGMFMHLILMLLAASVAIWIDRIYALNFKFNINGVAFWDILSKKVMSGDYAQAVQICKENEKALLPRILMAGLQKAGGTEREIQDAIDESNLESIPLLELRTPYLGILANVATLTGLLGTIWGLISAFAAVAVAPPDQKQQALTLGISIAMNTTAFGLITAIPTMIIHGLLQGRTNKIISDVDMYSVKLINILSSTNR
jgi:biopolymer transport protein ExbB